MATHGLLSDVQMLNYMKLMSALGLDPAAEIQQEQLDDIALCFETHRRSQQEAFQSHEDHEDEPVAKQNQKCLFCRKVAKVAQKSLRNLVDMKIQVEQLVQNSIFAAFMMNTLIDDLLDLAKLENSAFQLNMSEFNLIETVQDVFSLLMFQAENKGIRLILAFDPEKAHMLQHINSDKRRMMQIMVNFISNSLKFTMRKGFIRVTLQSLEEQIIETSTQMRRSRKMSSMMQLMNPIGSVTDVVHKYFKLLVTVEDNGVGISKDNQAKLFQDFAKLHEHKHMNLAGTGLGLSICKNIIEQMGGSVVVESEEGVGTKFKITIGLKA